MNYTKIPNTDISFLWVPRTASHAICKALLETYWPEKIAEAAKIHRPAHISLPPYQFLLPSTPHPETKTLIGLIRDPIERFRSACARTNRTATEGIAAVASDNHFTPVSVMVRGNTVNWFKFPDQLASFCSTIGIQVPAVLNESEESTKPTLTAEEAEQVAAIYAEDIALFEAAQGLTAELEPTPEPQPPTKAELIKAAEAHISQYFTAFGLLEGLKKLTQAQAANNLAAIPKTVAVAQWVETVKQMALAGQTNFPPSPHTFDEVVGE